MKVRDITCKRCNELLTKDYSGYLTIEESSSLMNAHDKVKHQNSYKVEFVG